MPIIEPTLSTAPLFCPTNDYAIARYLDLTKFISMLHTQSLFFCRVDKLEDKFEGSMSLPTSESIQQFLDTPMDNIGKTIETTSGESFKSILDLQRKMKSTICINCWNKYGEYESAALWKIYSHFSKGIMIKSSISKLLASLENTKEDVGLSEVQYIDHRRDQMRRQGNFMDPFNYKYKAYKYEDEVRLIYDVTENFASEYDWSKEEVKEGRYIKADIAALIDEIIISPHSPKWFYKLIQDVCEKYNLDKNIKRSELIPD